MQAHTPRVTLRDAFLEAHGWGDADLVHLAGDASFRSYKRLKRQVEMTVLPDAPPPEGCKPFVGKDIEHVVLMDAPPPKEDVRPFITIDRYLRHQGLNAPEILAEDVDNGFLLLEDFGDDRYTSILDNTGNRDLERTMYHHAIDVLASLHKCPPPRDVRPYSAKMLMFECHLLTDWYLPLIHGVPTSESLKREYTEFWNALLPATEMRQKVLVLRDYHADNLMWMPARTGLDKVGLLDFQDAVIGSPAYDLVSLLEDARRDVAPDFAEEMKEYYLRQIPSIPREEFLTSYALLGAQRNMKILGIFARLALRDGKYNYRVFMPRVWGCLERDLQHPLLQPIRAWLDEVLPESLRKEVPPVPEKAVVS